MTDEVEDEGESRHSQHDVWLQKLGVSEESFSNPPSEEPKDDGTTVAPGGSESGGATETLQDKSRLSESSTSVGGGGLSVPAKATGQSLIGQIQAKGGSGQAASGSAPLPPLSGEIWFSAATSHVPWKEWTAQQREQGAEAYDAARRRVLRRAMDPAARQDVEQEERDNLVIDLLDSHKDDFKTDRLSRSKIVLTSTPFGQSTERQKVLLIATVFMPEGKLTPTGTIRFDAVVGKSMRQQLKMMPVKDGKASWTESGLPKGSHYFQAAYIPDTNAIVASISDPLDHEVK